MGYVYLSDGPLPENDGEVLVIEIDGKAAPTATEQELGFSRTFREDGSAHAASTRWRKRSKLARPYMLRLMSFRRLTWPSTCPFGPTVNYTQSRGWGAGLYGYPSLPSPFWTAVSPLSPAAYLG